MPKESQVTASLMKGPAPNPETVAGSLPQSSGTGDENATAAAVRVPRERVARMQNSAPTAVQPQRVRRYLGWALLGMIVLAVCVPVGLWIHYRVVHVMSRNAMVRGHLAELGTRINGVLADVNVEEGARVAAGQVLGRLEDSYIRSDVKEAQAEVDGLEQKLAVERLAVVHEQRLLANKLQEADAHLIASDAEVAAAKSEADNARESYEQRKLLLRSNAISKENIRVADTKRKTSLAMLTVAEENQIAARLAKETVRLEMEGLEIRKQRIGVLEADVLRAKARLDGANADLESSLIRAPDDGAIVRWLVKLGGSVKVGKPVVSMWLGDDLWVEAWIDEDEIAKVAVGSKAIVTLQSFPGREFSGVVEQIGLTTDFEMPTFDDIPQPRFARMRGAPVVGVLVRLLDPSAKLLPGLSAVVAIRATDG